MSTSSSASQPHLSPFDKPPPSPGTPLPRHDSGLALTDSESVNSSRKSSSSSASQDAPTQPQPSLCDTIIFNTSPFSSESNKISLRAWREEIHVSETAECSGCVNGREWVVRARTPMSWEERLALRPKMRGEIRWGVTPSVVGRRGAVGGCERA